MADKETVIGPETQISGEVRGEEDLIVRGRIDGKSRLPQPLRDRIAQQVIILDNQHSHGVHLTRFRPRQTGAAGPIFAIVCGEDESSMKSCGRLAHPCIQERGLATIVQDSRGS